MPEFPTVHFAGDETGLFSTVEIQALMRSECARASRYGYPVTAMMIAVDRLDQLGDLYGSESRDAILTEVSGVLRRTTRESDYLGCMVGSYFLGIFPHTSREIGPALANRLLREAARLQFDAGSSRVHVSLSIGLVHREGDEGVDYEAMCREVRGALDQAIAAGGNCQRVYTPPEPTSVAMPDLGGNLEEIGTRLEMLLNTKVEEIFSSMGVDLPDFGGRQKEVLERAVQKMEAAHAQMKEEHAQQVDQLERRLAKLAETLETTEGMLHDAKSRGVDSGVSSIYRTVQGLSDVEGDLELKRELMARIYEANVELRKELSQQNADD